MLLKQLLAFVQVLLTFYKFPFLRMDQSMQLAHLKIKLAVFDNNFFLMLTAAIDHLKNQSPQILFLITCLSDILKEKDLPKQMTLLFFPDRLAFLCSLGKFFSPQLIENGHIIYRTHLFN